MRAAAGLLAIIAATSVAAVLLAGPQGALAPTMARAFADCLAVGVLGLAIVPALDAERRRTELVARAAMPLAVFSAAWLLAELTRQVTMAAQTAGLAVPRLPISVAAEFTMHTTAGRAGLVSIVTATLACVVAAIGRRSAPHLVVVAGAAAVGIAARVVSGHLSGNPVGAAAVAAHAIAAAVWCGGLGALALTVTHRGQWARVLPRFSTLALLCAVVLLLSGAVGALTVLEALSQLLTSGYGRLLLAKIGVAAVLVAIGWRNRTAWLPAVRTHHATADMSQRRAATEVGIMAAALTLAAGLAVTG